MEQRQNFAADGFSDTENEMSQNHSVHIICVYIILYIPGYHGDTFNVG